MKIYIASDHAGFHLKKQLIQYLKVKDFEVEDCGAYELDEADDYPDFIIPCAQKVSSDPKSVGIVIGGSGQGEAICANKVKGIRAAVFYGSPSASSGSSIPRLAKEHNNANIFSLGARLISPDDAKKAVSSWLDAKFEGGRHVRRLDKIAKIEETK